MDKREQERLKTRKAILDAAAELMREDGYAAVTSRRVAEVAGLKSQLVHYHFGSMDELFLDLLRRNDAEHLAIQMKALTSVDPLHGFWTQSLAREGAELVAELTAAANHRKLLQDELAQIILRFRIMFNTMISSYFERNAIDNGEYSPQVISFLISSVASRLTMEASLGTTEGHDEVMAFMDGLLKSLGSSGSAAVSKTPRSSRRR